MHQEVNPLFELFFLAILLTSLGIAVAAVIAVFRGRWSAALSRAKLLLLLDAAYLALVFCISLLSPCPVLSAGDLECFDDWCVSAQRVEYRSELGTHRAKGQFALVHLKVVSQARRVYQSEKLAKVEIRGDDGTWRAPPPDAQGYLSADVGVQPSLTRRVGPGESFSTVLVFDVPLNTRQIALRMNHGNGPSCFIIGESHCLRSGTEFRLSPQRAFEMPGYSSRQG